MKILEFPLGEIPYIAIDRLTTLKMSDPKMGWWVPLFDDHWTSSDMSQDLRSGRPTPLVYWYPSYADTLYDMSLEGQDFRKFLIGFHPENLRWFTVLFKEQVRKLDKLAAKNLKLNHLNEATIKNGVLKL
jgi:hypothetical protein